MQCHRGENQTIHDAKSWKIQLSFITYIKGDGMYSFKAQSLPGSESKVPDLPTCFQRNGKSHWKTLKISRGQRKCKPMKASVFSLDSCFSSILPYSTVQIVELKNLLIPNIKAQSDKAVVWRITALPFSYSNNPFSVLHREGNCPQCSDHILPDRWAPNIWKCLPPTHSLNF